MKGLEGRIGYQKSSNYSYYQNGGFSDLLCTIILADRKVQVLLFIFNWLESHMFSWRKSEWASF